MSVPKAKATRNIFRRVKSKAQSFWGKFGKIATEIAIIVFSVSLSIGFHSLREKRSEQHQVKEFFRGLKVDLTKDIKDMKTDIAAYELQKKGFLYLSSIPKGETAKLDSINKYSPYTYSFTGFAGNTGRYEGFKSSGKIGFIENENLQNSILDLYEEKLPILNTSTNYYKNQKLKFADYVIENSVDYPNGTFLKVVASDPAKNRSQIFLSKVDPIIANYNSCIDLMEDIVKKIDSIYPPKKGD